MKSKNDALTPKDKNLNEAVKMFEKDWIASYPNELELAGKFIYSKRHTKRMNRMLKNHDSWFYRVTCTTKRQVATIVITMLIAFNIVMITSVEVRAVVIDFFVTVYENFSDVLFPSDSAPSEIVDYYEPSYVPNGYSVEFIDEGSIESLVMYMDNKNNVIYFIQATLDEAELGIDTEGSEIEHISISGDEGVIIYNKNIYSLSWSNNEYRFSLIGGDRAEIFKMAESLIVLKKVKK